MSGMRKKEHHKDLVQQMEDDANQVQIRAQERARLKAKRATKEDIQGPDLTTRIMKISKDQIQEIEKGEEDLAEPRVNIPSDEEEIEDDGLILDNETNDPETAALFKMFHNEIAAQINHGFSKTLSKTSAIGDPKIKQVYIELGSILKNYVSGKLPKALCVLASTKTPDWLDLILLTDPENWSANAVEVITKLFQQSASSSKKQLYYRQVLLRYVCGSLEKVKKLPRAVWKALIAASKSPADFVRGFLQPLAFMEECTVKEARVISSIVMRIRLPREHLSAFIIQICTYPDGPAPSVAKTMFIARFVAKGQALAMGAIDAILAYFMSFLGQEGPLPMVWHNALWDFVKHYGQFLTAEMREALGQLVSKHRHPRVTPQIDEFMKQNPAWVEPPAFEVGMFPPPLKESELNELDDE